MAKSSFSGPVRSQNGFQGYNPDEAANASLVLSAQGTGVVINTTSVTFFEMNPETVTTAGAVTYTPAQLKTGFILRDPNGAGRDAAETITMTTNTGLTLSGTMTIAQNAQKDFLLTFTNVGTAAVTVYSMGSVTF